MTRPGRMKLTHADLSGNDGFAAERASGANLRHSSWKEVDVPSSTTQHDDGSTADHGDQHARGHAHAPGWQKNWGPGGRQLERHADKRNGNHGSG